MQSNFYQSIFNHLHFGFAFHQIITDTNGKPVDYRFLEVNHEYEKLTGLKANHLIGKKASAVIKGFENSEMAKVPTYGKIALNGGSETTVHYSDQLSRWYQVQVISQEKGFFALVFTDTSNQYLMAEASKELGQFTANNIDYHGIAQRMQDISGADYCFINVYGNNGEGSVTVAASGIEKNIAKAVSLLGFNLVGKSWNYDPVNEEKIRRNKITRFSRLSELVGKVLPGSIIKMIETMFNLGEAVVVRTTKDDVSIGDITLLFKQNKHLKNQMLVEAFADITGSTISRIAAEQHLDQTKLTYENIFNSLTESIYVLDEKGLFMEVNQGACKMYGYHREELVGQSPQTVAAPGMNDLNAVMRKMVRVGNSGKPARFEFWAKRKNGEIFPKDVILNRGKYFGKDVVIAVARDITEIKKTEHTLIESKVKFQNLIELAVDGILIGSYDGKIIQSNSRFCAMIGMSNSELIGKHIESLPFTPESVLNNPFRFDLLQKGETVISERCLRIPDGSIIDVEMRTKMMPDKTYQSIIIDITDRKKLENTQKIILEISQLSIMHDSLHSFLAAIHQKINKIIRSKNFYVALYDSDSNTYSFPYHVDEIDKVPLDTPLDRSGGFTDYVRKNGKVLLRRGISINNPDIKEPLSGIGDVPSVWLGLPLKINPNDAAIGVMAVQDYHNFEAYNEVEITILELIANKIGVFIERVKNFEDLKKAKEKAEESDRLKSAFLMNMSHEIRTPMNGILGFINLLESPDIDEESRKSYLDVVNKSGQRLLNTINDIIEVSRIEAGELNVKLEEVNVEKLMQFQYDFFRPQAAEKNIHFQLSGQVLGDAAIVCTDKHKLEGILSNLIKNAIKFTSEGVIDIGNKIDNDRMAFWISDTGRGIPADRLDVVFDQFVQAELAITRAHEGSGLGLSIVKAYVEAIGGEIHVQSEVGKGSSFHFSIPYKTLLNHTIPDVETTSNNSIPNGLTILIAEDEDVSYQFLRIILTKSGFKVIRSITGSDAVKALGENPSAALILMDIRMPGMDGLEATKQIRKFNKTIPIIAQTAHAFVGEKEKAMLAGCNDYISKPIDKEKLLDLIKGYLEKDSGEA